MAGHVPKFGAQNAGNFTEVFTLARTGGKAGSGDSAASQEDAPLRNPRAAPGGRGRGGGAGGAPPRRAGSGSGSGSGAGSGSGGYEKDHDHPDPGRRGSGAHERDSGTRSSQEGGTRPLPTARAEYRDGSGRGGRGTRKPRNVNEEPAGASHLPKFGDWNNGEAGEPNYTVMFQAAIKERQMGSAGDMGSKSNKSSGDHSRSSNGGAPKKPSSSWWCFG